MDGTTTNTTGALRLFSPRPGKCHEHIYATDFPRTADRAVLPSYAAFRVGWASRRQPPSSTAIGLQEASARRDFIGDPSAG